MKRKEPIVIIGASSFASCFIDIIIQTGQYEIIGLIDCRRCKGEQVKNYPILGAVNDIKKIAYRHHINHCAIAIGDNYQRFCVHKKVSTLLPQMIFPLLKHPNATITPSANVGEGTMVMPGAIVGAFTSVGKFCIINSASSASHDSVFSDYSSLGPHASVGGSVNVGNLSAICQGATVIHKINVGENCIVGAASLLLTDQPDNTVVVGTPAKFLKKRVRGDTYL